MASKVSIECANLGTMTYTQLLRVSKIWKVAVEQRHSNHIPALESESLSDTRNLATSSDNQQRVDVASGAGGMHLHVHTTSSDNQRVHGSQAGGTSQDSESSVSVDVDPSRVPVQGGYYCRCDNFPVLLCE